MKHRISHLSPFYLRTGHSVRLVHSTASKRAFAPAASSPVDQLAAHDESSIVDTITQKPKASPLAILPFSSVLRTYLITTLSSSPLLINSTISVILRLLNAKTPLADPDRNPVLKYLFKKTFYSQFCVGENKIEVRESVSKLRKLGYEGVIFESALEVLKPKNGLPAAESEITKREIAIWRQGLVDTIDMAEPGDCVGLKWSGLGALALHLLQTNQTATPLMQAAIDEVVSLAHAKGILLLPSAEEEHTNVGSDAWTMNLQRKFNTTPGKATIFITYQAYLKSTPGKLAAHLALAQKEGWTAGIKLVRGAYLASEPRSAIWPTIEETHACYDGLADACLRREWNDILKPAPTSPSSSPPSFPQVSVFLATHNAVSVDRAMALRNAQCAADQPRPELAYGQLFGMADEVSTQILAVRREALAGRKGVDVPRAFKCVCWGSTGQTLNYLLRRAAENKDAIMRTGETRAAMRGELGRRVRGFFGLV